MLPGFFWEGLSFFDLSIQESGLATKMDQI